MLITVCAMTATIMQALDTTIANVALALHAGLAVGLARPDQLGADVLHRCCRNHDCADRLVVRPLRPQEAVHHLRRRLHRRVVPVRAGAEHRANGAVSAAAGHGRRRAGAAVAIRAARCLFGGGTRAGDGDLGRRRDARPDHGPDARRLADRQLLLALGVPDQSADRRHHRARDDAVHGGDQTQEHLRFDWFGFARARRRHRLAAIDCSIAANRSAGSAPTKSGSR